MPDQMETSQLLSRDRDLLWHPYTNTLPDNPLYLVERASGVHIELASGQRLVDGMSSWWSVIHGYNHPRLNHAVNEQLKRMSHVMFGNLTHRPAIELADKLLAMTDRDFERVFFADSGSVSVEVAIKMAIQYWFAQGHTNKRRLLTVRNGYHGDTFAAMSVTDPVNGMHSMFRGVLPEHIFVDIPQYGTDISWRDELMEPLEQAISSHAHELAAVIVEPLVQGAGGMKFYHPEYLRQLRRICDQQNLLLIFDEIATGFGRSGELFAYQEAATVPDIMCVGKALTGGYMTLAATLASAKVVAGIHADNNTASPGLLMHGPTFMANPLACSVALASLELLEENNWHAQVSAINEQLLRELEPCRAFDGVADVRVKGAIGVVETKQAVDVKMIMPMFVERGVWVRPFGKLIYVMPPYVISADELRQVTSAIGQVAAGL